MSIPDPGQRLKTATHARSASALPSLSSSPTSSSAPASLATRTPLGAARTVRPSHSNGQLAREFQDRHSTTYAHLYAADADKENDPVLRDKLDKERKAVEAERLAAKDRRDAYLKTLAQNAGREHAEMGEAADLQEDEPRRKSAWRPLSLVAKRQAVGHARSASAATVYPTDGPRLAAQGIRSVSHTPSSSMSGIVPRHLAIDRLRSAAPATSDTSDSRRQRNSTSLPLSMQPNLEVVVEGQMSPDDRMEEMRSEISSRDSASVNRYRPVSLPASEQSGSGSRAANASTYSWATSFSGETAELRTAAHYVGSGSDDHGSMDSTPSRHSTGGIGQPGGPGRGERTDTPPRVKQRRKKIITLAHTVRQLEGVGSREPEDPDFYEKLVKAWNERPGVIPVPLPTQAQPRPILQTAESIAMGALSHAPPVFGASHGHGYDATPAMTEPSPAMGVRSPGDAELATPAMPQEGVASTSRVGGYGYGYGYGYGDYDNAHGYGEYDQTFGHGDRASRVTRSTRYSYASTLHDLALEGGYVQGTRLMEDKPWLRADDNIHDGVSAGGYSDRQLAQGVTSRFGAGLGDAFDMPPPAFGGVYGAYAAEDEAPMSSTPHRTAPTGADSPISTPLPPPISHRRTTPPSGASTNRNSFDKLQAGIATGDWLRPSRSPLAGGSGTAASTTTSTPTRPLRRIEGQVLRYGQPLSAGLPEGTDMDIGTSKRKGDDLLDVPPPLPTRPDTAELERVDRRAEEQAQQGWGLGFMSTWWNERQSAQPEIGPGDMLPGTARPSQAVPAGLEQEEQGFHLGKDGNRSSRRMEMDWESWTRTKGTGTSVSGDADINIAGASTAGTPPVNCLTRTLGQAQLQGQGQTRVLVQGRKRPRGSSWSSGTPSRAASSSYPHGYATATNSATAYPPPSFPYQVNQATPADRVPRGEMEWLGTDISRAQTPTSYMTRTSTRHSRHSRQSRTSNAQTATTSSPMYSYPVSSDSSFSATYPQVLGSGVRAHQRAFSTGSVGFPVPYRTSQPPSIPLPVLPLPVPETRIDFTRSRSDLDTQHLENAGPAGSQIGLALLPPSSTATSDSNSNGASTAPATTGSMGEGEAETGEREFPFSSLCRRPSSSTHSHTSFLPPQPLSVHHPLPDRHAVENLQGSGSDATAPGASQARPTMSREDSRLAQARRAAELGLGPPPVFNTVRWIPSAQDLQVRQEDKRASLLPAPTMRREQVSQDGQAHGLYADEPLGLEPRAKERTSKTPEVGDKKEQDGLRGWASSLFPSRLPALPAREQGQEVVSAAASSIPMKRQSGQMAVDAETTTQPQAPSLRPRLSSRPQLSTVRQRPSLTIRVPPSQYATTARIAQEDAGGRKRFVKRKSVSPARAQDAALGDAVVDLRMRVQVQEDLAMSPPGTAGWNEDKLGKPAFLSPSAALIPLQSTTLHQHLHPHSTLTHAAGPSSGNDAGTASGPPTSTSTSGYSHDELFLPPPATPLTPVTPGTPETPAESSYSVFLGMPLSPLPTPPLPVGTTQQWAGDGPREKPSGLSLTATLIDDPIQQYHHGYPMPAVPTQHQDHRPLTKVPSMWMTSKSSTPPRPPSSTPPSVLPTMAEGASEGAHVGRYGGPSVPQSLPHHLLRATETPAIPGTREHRTRPSSGGSSFPTGYIGGDATLCSPPRARAPAPAALSRPDGVIRPDSEARGDVLNDTFGPASAMAGEAQVHPQVTMRPLATRKSIKPAAFFWLGLVMPWFWLIAGWGLASSASTTETDGQAVQDAEKGVGAGVATTAVGVGGTAAKSRSWLYHPNPWCRRSRVASATVLPGVAVAAVVGVVVLAVLR